MSDTTRQPRTPLEWAKHVRRYDLTPSAPNPLAEVIEQQAAQIEEKDAEIARLISTKEHIRKEINAMIGRVEDDAVLIEALRADAERYRWLRMRDWFDSELCVLRDPKRVLTEGIGLGADCPSLSRLDAAIDAALRQEQPNE